MESDSKFKQSIECEFELNYNFISGYKIEVELMTINEQQDALPGKPDPFVLKFATKWMSRREKLEKLGNQPKKFTNVYIKNFGEDMDDDRLKELAEKFGHVLNLKVVIGESGRSKGFGFVSYETTEQAQLAVDELCGKEWNGKKLYAARAQKKAERLMDLKSQFEKKKSEGISRYQGVNLYVKNLDDTIDDGRLREEFSAYGTITSAKVMMDDKDNSKGFGFVCFSSPEEATKAVTELNGRVLVSKPLSVALAQRKEERKAQLAAQHMQRVAGLRMQQAAGQPVGQVFPQAGAFYMQPLAQANNKLCILISWCRLASIHSQLQCSKFLPAGSKCLPAGI
ncbi:polyadenylate-binding protein 1-like [Acropora muricata]|uniref:polyadenylate-binding protein 1-like n=1 Tax=Acropora muricata TaxID=159855 RepID=UPI0034E3A573